MGKIFHNKHLHGNSLLEVGSVDIVNDASTPNHAVRKSQAETIAATAVQAKIVSSIGQALDTNTYSANFVQSALDSKQPLMTVDASSTAYLEIVDGNKIKLKDLGVIGTYRDSTHQTLDQFIAAATYNGNGTITIGGQTLDKMTYIFLQTATNPSEKSFIYLGTNNEDSTDYVSFSIDYNQQTIRSFFSGLGTGIQYDSATGSYSLLLGNSIGQLGAHTVPVNSAEFNVINGDTVLAILKALETFITDVDTNATGGNTTVNTRLSNLSGVSNNNMGTFTNGLLTPNSNIKALIQELETLAKSAISDNTAIRNEFAAADAVLQASINSETLNRVAAINSEISTRSSADTTLQSNIDGVTNSLTTEVNRAKAAELQNQTNIENESAARIEAIANEVTNRTNAITSETLARQAADANIQAQIDALAGSNVELVGTVNGAGAFVAVDGDDGRNGQNFVGIEMKSGEVVIIDQDITMLGTEFRTGDTLTVKVATIAAGSMELAHFIYQRGSGTDLTRSNLNGDTIMLNLDQKLIISPDSITYEQLHEDVEVDINSKRSLTGANVITSDGDYHNVSSNTLGAQQNVYNKRTQANSGALTGTARTILTELHVHSKGSGNPISPSYAHATTVSSHYAGSCTDVSMIMAGGNFEANGKHGTSIQATGVYGTAMSEQGGVNVGGTFVADGAGTSNLGAIGFASTDGIGADRGLYGAVANMSLLEFSAARMIDPVPHNDVAVVADAKYAPVGSKALYAYGDSVFEGGKVIVPNASDDNTAVNLDDIKSRQRCYQFDLVDGLDKVINVAGIDLDKSIIQVTDDNVSVDISVVRDATNNHVTVTAHGGSLTGVRLLIQELSCDVVVV